MKRPKTEKERIQNIEYLNTEHGYMISKYNDCKKSAKRKNFDDCLTKEEFFELWEKHKKNFGMRCYYSLEKMTINRKLATKGAKKRHPANKSGISVDRFDSTIGYTKNNVVFCRWDFNNTKNNISVKHCYMIIKRHQERMGLERLEKDGSRRMYSLGGMVYG